MRAVRCLVPLLGAAIAVSGLVLPTAAHALTAATVAITTPTAGTVVDGTVTVTVDGNVDATALSATTTVLLVDGTPYATSQTCTWSAAADCRTTFSWDAHALIGTHTLTAQLLDLGGDPLATTVAETAVTVHTGTRITLNRLGTQKPGHTAYLHGTVTATNNGERIPRLLVRLTLKPATGGKKVLTARTGSTGAFTVPAKLAADTTVTAAVAAAPGVTTSSAKTSVAVLAPITCKAEHSVRRGAFGSGSCTVPHLPAKTTVTLEYASGHTWHTFGKGKASGAKVPIAYSFPKRGTYHVRLVVAASKVYATTASAPFTVTVR